jgi:hypothetical protein
MSAKDNAMNAKVKTYKSIKFWIENGSDLNHIRQIRAYEFLS